MAAPPMASQENGGTDWVTSSPLPENNPSASITTAASIGLLINSANPRVISWTANPPIEASRANQVRESPTHCEIGNTNQSGIVDNQLGPTLVARTNAITATTHLTDELAKRGRLSIVRARLMKYQNTRQGIKKRTTALLSSVFYQEN